MNKLYKGQKHSTYEIHKAIGVSKDTLYKYIRNERNVENMPIKMLMDIAYFEKIEVNELFEKLKEAQNGRTK